MGCPTCSDKNTPPDLGLSFHISAKTFEPPDYIAGF